MNNLTKHVNGKGKRFTSSKVSFGQIPPSAIREITIVMAMNPLGLKTLPMTGLSELAKHYMFGQAKYPDNLVEDTPVRQPNWSAGMYMQDMFIESILRHLNAYLMGEALDEDFGCHHLRAVAWGYCNLIHMFDNYSVYERFDDRHWAGFRTKPVDFFTSPVSEDLIINQLVLITNFVQCSSDEKQIIRQLSYAIILCLHLIDVDLYSGSFNETGKLGAEFSLSEETQKQIDDIRNTQYGTAKVALSTE